MADDGALGSKARGPGARNRDPACGSLVSLRAGLQSKCAKLDKVTRCPSSPIALRNHRTRGSGACRQKRDTAAGAARDPLRAVSAHAVKFPHIVRKRANLYDKRSVHEVKVRCVRVVGGETSKFSYPSREEDNDRVRPVGLREGAT